MLLEALLPQPARVPTQSARAAETATVFFQLSLRMVLVCSFPAVSYTHLVRRPGGHLAADPPPDTGGGTMSYYCETRDLAVGYTKALLQNIEMCIRDRNQD